MCSGDSAVVKKLYVQAHISDVFTVCAVMIFLMHLSIIWKEKKTEKQGEKHGWQRDEQDFSGIICRPVSVCKLCQLLNIYSLKGAARGFCWILSTPSLNKRLVMGCTCHPNTKADHREAPATGPGARSAPLSTNCRLMDFAGQSKVLVMGLTSVPAGSGLTSKRRISWDTKQYFMRPRNDYPQILISINVLKWLK